MNKDSFFRISVYFISFYFLLIQKSLLTNLCGIIILLSHLYKDITGLDRWPKWTEYFGISIGSILIHQGINIHNNFVILIGILKLKAHLCQFINGDNQYYY